MNNISVEGGWSGDGVWRVVVLYQAEETSWPEAGDRQMQLEAAGAQSVMWGGSEDEAELELKRQMGIQSEELCMLC